LKSIKRGMFSANKYEELQESLLRNIHDIIYLASIFFLLTFVYGLHNVKEIIN